MFPHTADPGSDARTGASTDLARQTRDWMVVTAVVLFALFALMALYAVLIDSGQLAAVTGSYLHEFAHDGRHLFGAPCH